MPGSMRESISDFVDEQCKQYYNERCESVMPSYPSKIAADDRSVQKEPPFYAQMIH